MGGPQIADNPFKPGVRPAMPPRVPMGAASFRPGVSLPADDFSLRFAGKDASDFASTFSTQVGKSFKRYYMGASARKFFQSLVFMTPKPEDEAAHLEQRLWGDIFQGWTEQPEQTRRQLAALDRQENLAETQPLTSFFLKHVGDVLDNPNQLYREVSLASLAMMTAGLPKTQELVGLIRGKAFKELPAEKQMSVAIPALQPFIQPLLKKPLVLNNTVKSYIDSLRRFPASPQRDAGLVALNHVKSLIFKPEELAQQATWFQAKLDGGGWEKLAQLRELATHHERYTPEQQATMLFDGWETIAQSAMATPIESRTVVTALRQSISDTLPGGPVRDISLKVADRLLDGMTQPQVLQDDLRFLRTLVSQNGFQRIRSTATALLSPTFDQASEAEKKRVIGAALNGVLNTLAADPAHSAKLVDRAALYATRQLPVGFKQTAVLGALNYLKANLGEPETIRLALPPVENFFSRNSLASLDSLIKPLTDPSFNALPGEQKQQHLETVMTTVYTALAAQPKQAAEWLHRVERRLEERVPAGSKRAILGFALTHLRDNLDKPLVMQQEIKLVAQVLGNGGLGKLQTLIPMLRSPQFLQADALTRGHAILEGLGDIFKPLLNKPAEAQAVLASWLETLDKSYPPGLVRDTVSLLGTHLSKNLDKPEKLTKALQLIQEILDSGGFKKMDNLERVVQSDAFKTAPPMKQGQYLLEGLGPIFVKAFQTLSTIPDLFKPHIQESMKQLYEDITPIPFEEIRSVVESELGMPIDQAFDSFDPLPLKAGSVAQVHRAVVNGHPVAVKVVKPDVERLMDEDINLLKPFVLLGQQMAPHLDANAFYEAFRALIKNEANMSKTSPNEPDGEAQRLIKIREIYKDMPNVIVPQVFPAQTSKHVLTMEFMPGKSLLNYKNDAEMAKNYLGMLLDQIFYYGACQADPHPGNVLYQPETKKFACIDAGLMYFSSPEERLAFAKILVALYTQNVTQIAHAVVPPAMAKHPNFEKFMAKLQSMPMLQQKNMDYKSTLLYLNTVAQVAQEHSLDVVTVNPLLWKTLFTAVAVAKTLDSNVNIAYPAIAKLAGLFISEREAGFMGSAAWTVIKDQSGRWWDYVSDRWGKLGQ